MDPVAVLVGVGTTLKIMKEIWDGLQWMHRVYETHTEGDKTLQSMALECNIYAESIKTIGQWLKKNQAAPGLRRQVRTTHNAITLVQVSMANVLLDLRRFKDTGDKTTFKNNEISKQKENIKLFQQFIMNKAKLQWFQQIMTMHLVALRAHAATLHLTLGVIELTGHTSEHKEKTPGKLKDKTGKLEKRLLLRQIITKALEIRRAEIAELARRGELVRLPPGPLSGSSQNSPRKLTFYDVVQLARQQALVEKTRMSSEDLIDLSDTPQPVLNVAPLPSVQLDHDLLDSSGPTALPRIEPYLPFQHESETPGLDPAIAELDATSSQEPSAADLLGLGELQASEAGSIHELEPIELSASVETTKQPAFPLEPIELSASVETSKQPIFQLHSSSEALRRIDRDTDVKPAALEPVRYESSLAGGSDLPKANESCAPPPALDQLSVPIHQSSTALIDQGNDTDENLADNSSTSSAAPSLFSHSSSLTGATGLTLPGITEEDVQARNSSSLASLKSPSFISKSSPSPATRLASGPAGPSEPKNPAHGYGAKLFRSPGINSTPTTYADVRLPSKPQRTESGDSVSLCPPLPQLSNIDEPDEQGFPWIVQAARDGNGEIVRKLLVSGADVQASHSSTRRNALSEASIQGHRNIVDLLIEEGCPLEYPDAEGNTALHHACRRGHLAVAKSLITSGALINALGPQGQTALHLAMQAPHQSVVMLLIQHNASVNARDASFRTPLHIGASQGNAAMCNYLLNEGADLDSREAQSKTPLQLACEAGHYELVQMMLDQSKLNPTNMTFLTAFLAAVEYGHVRVAESFFPHGLKLQQLKKDSHKPATLAAKSGCLAMVELMIQEDCNIHGRDDNGWNALHFASHHGHYQVIERLIASDVSAEAITSRKETPLLFAVKGGHFAVAERLLRSNKGGNLVSAEDEQGQQPIHHTVRVGSIEIFNLLMSNGARITVENSFGWQPLHIATAYGHIALVERLLQQGANIEEKLGSSSIKKDQTHKIIEQGYWAEARWPYPGSRPLHLACEYAHDQIAQYLISKGTKMEATCSEGWQPLHHATYFGSPMLVGMLLDGGVNPHATTNEGKTALALQFCTSGAPISEDGKERIRNLLRVAMDKVKKQKSFKVALKRGSTVEEKNNLVRAATFSMNVVSRPHLHKATTTAQASSPASTHIDSGSILHRPRFPHLPHTSPLPVTVSQSVSSSQHLPVVSQAELKSPALPTTTDSILKDTNTSTLEASSQSLTTTTKAANQPSPSNTTVPPNPAPTPTTSTQVSAQSLPKTKRRSAFGLSRAKPGLDISKLGLGQHGEAQQRTLSLVSKTSDIRRQTLELGKQGLGKSRQGLEAIQGLEMGKQGLNISKEGYRKAKKFARKGKIGGRWGDKSGRVEGPDAQDEDGTVKDGGDVDVHVDDEDHDDDNDNDDDESDDVGSAFSLGEFAEVGSGDF